MWRAVAAEMGERFASEGLAEAEEKVEVARLSNSGRGVWFRVVVNHRINGSVEVVGEVETNRPSRCVIAKACANRMREVVEAAITLPAY